MDAAPTSALHPRERALITGGFALLAWSGLTFAYLRSTPNWGGLLAWILATIGWCLAITGAYDDWRRHRA